ncbi:collagenase [Microbacterium sp. H1-D42]|uniref:collagenase n=1 Tax=Microbacterium sp. H1-D42 TaxID=2925844 RepID=UPI001F53014F|nr:collagenase [Microbacterium sp. H1-D42]UNK71563.1 collagenase [Microbacterium sp. H1-D42]
MLLSVAVCAGIALVSPTAAFGTSAAPDPGQDDSTSAPSYISGLVSPESVEEVAALPPISANTDALRTVAGEPETAPERPSMQQRTASKTMGARAAAAACTTADFAAASPSALSDLITSSTTDCVNTLFSVTGEQAADIFTESKMVAAANALRTVAQSYAGDNSTSAAQLVLFLRAGYYVQYYNSSVVPAFGTALRAAVSGALDEFFGNPRSQDVSDANGETLSEAVTLIDSAELNDRYIHVVKRLLTDYDANYDSSWWMLNAVNGTFTVLFRGHQVPAFVQQVAADTSLLSVLRDFALEHVDLIGGDNAYLVTNAGRELGRFLGDPEVKAAVKPMVKSVLDQTSLDGATSGLWVAVAQMADWYDAADCSYYGTCDLQERIEAHVLPTTHVCSSSITIRAQDMNSAELDDSCASLNAQDAYFHAVAKDPGPVPDDVNTNIEVVVFDSSDDYQTYAGSLFGIDTNNGGMYLEGDPSQANNKARFIAYEAEWLRPDFAIWNLNHEYTHYLDGRFNMHGDFTENISTPTIWWVEGFAEYISYHYRAVPYTEAQQLAATGQYKLSTLFDTTYDHGTDRIYRWGYLAVSFMLNERPDEMQTVLGKYRSGDWAAARSYLKDSIGTADDDAFAAFLAKCAQGDCSADLGGGEQPPQNQAPTAAFTVEADGLTATFTDGSSDTDGQIANRTWSFGDGTTSTEKSPVVTYAETGTFTVKLTVTDDKGATATATRSVTVTAPDTGNPDPDDTWTVPECADPDVRLLGQACGRMGLTAEEGDTAYLLVWVPSGTPQLTVTSGGGSGDADLYVGHSGWASPQNHVARSTSAGNGEQVVIDWPASGWNYVTLLGVEDFANVSVIAHY